jgi:hypothetical protein
MGDFEITKFMSKVDALGGVARKDRFTVEITPPRTLSSSIDASTINFLAKSISFPARSFGTATYRSGGRFALDVPYESSFEPVGITMLNTNNHAPRIFWTNWFEHIQSVDPNTRPRGNNYNMQYYKDFIGTVKISYFNDTRIIALSPDYIVTLHDAWPSVLGAIELGWENSDLGEFDIDIKYSRWTSKSGGVSYTGSGSGSSRGGEESYSTGDNVGIS